MTTSFRERRAQGGTGQSASRVLAISALFVGVLATAWLAGRDYVMPRAPVPAGIYKGRVQLAPDALGRCEQFEYDNKAGWMTPKGSAPCDDITTALLPPRSAGPSSGPMGRLDGIRGYFKSR